MSIPSVNPGPELLAASKPTPRGTPATGFAALADSLARNDLAGARAAVTATETAPRDDALRASIAEGHLAAARVLLATLDTVSSSAHGPTGSAPKTARPAGSPAPAASGRAANSATHEPIPHPVPAASPPVSVVDVGAAASSQVDVAAVLLAIATGNAGSIPADVINRYGPGGELYDPAAIMDAYRASSLGHAQIAATAWIGKTA